MNRLRLNRAQVNSPFADGERGGQDGRAMLVVAILSIRRAELDTFRAFEHHAARVMAPPGGRIERTVVVDDGQGELLREIHVVAFPDAAAWAAYRADPALLARSADRGRAVVASEILIGSEGPTYA
jgi:hypothetical protein